MLAPEAQKFLDRLKRTRAKPMNEMTALEAREYVAAQAKLTRKNHPYSIKVTDVVLTHHPENLNEAVHTPLRFYRPNEEGIPALILYFHGGGFTAGNCDYVDPFCHRLAKVTGALVISVDYHLAPEYPFPFAIFEGLSVLEMLLQHSDSYRFDKKAVTLMGDSAGANLAAVISNQIAEKAQLHSQILLYPVTDFAREYESHHTYQEGYFLTKASMDWSRQHYLQDLTKANDPLASPIFATGLEALPRTLIVTAQHDPLRDEGRAYAQHLIRFGVEVYYHEYAGMIHCFATFVDFFAQTSTRLMGEASLFIMQGK